MCGSTMVTRTSSPALNGIACSRTSASVPSSTMSKCSRGRPSEPVKWKCLPVSASSAWSIREPCPVNSELTCGFMRTRNASVARGARADLAQAALELDRHRLLAEHDAVAVAGRADAGHGLAHALGDVLAGHLDQPELGDLGGERLGAVLVEGLAQRLEHGVAVARAGHVD